MPRSTSISLLLLASVAFVGCQSVESTRLIGAVEEAAGSSEEAGERRVFLEVIRPEPAWVTTNEELRELWRTTSYEEDKQRPFRAFELPETYVLGVNDFKKSNSQAGVTGPYIAFQIRERQFVTVKKQHQVVTKSMLSGSKDTTRNIPAFSYWKWESDQPIRNGKRVRVIASDLTEEPGYWHEVEGTLHDKGILLVSLAPWLGADRIVGRKAPLNVQAACPELGLRIGIEITAEALFYLRQLQTEGVASPESPDEASAKGDGDG